MDRFIIAGTQRTGTSLTVSTLVSHPDIKCFGEVFHFRKGKGKRTPGSYRQYLMQDRFNRTLKHYLNNERQIRNYLDELYSTHGAQAVGFKFMLSQTRQFPAALRYVQDHRIKVLHVVRNNILKTLVSRVTAKQRKLYHSTENITVDKVYLRPRGLIRKLDFIASEARAWREAVSDNPYQKISYEDFVADRESVLKKALGFLGVKYIDNLTSHLKKINPNNLEDVILNYKEIKDCLRGSDYEKYL